MIVIEKIISWIVGIFLIVSIPYTIYFNIVHFYSKFKCRKKHYNDFLNRCHESNCRWAEFCECYHHIYSDEEIAKLKQLIDEMT